MSIIAVRRAPGAPSASSNLAARNATNPLRIAVLLSIAIVVTFCASELLAGSASARMQVSVTVVARAIMTVSSEPAAVNVTDADVARGYVDLPSPIVIQVRTNSRSGYLLQADRQQSGLGAIDLAFGDSAMTVGETQSWISRPYVAGGEVLELRARVHLDAETQPGSYPMPIALSVRPL